MKEKKIEFKLIASKSLNQYMLNTYVDGYATIVINFDKYDLVNDGFNFSKYYRLFDIDNKYVGLVEKELFDELLNEIIE
jgi:hypothetical protein